MQFTAHTNRTVDGVGRVTAGQPFDVDADAAAGLLGQCGPGGNYQPVDDEAKAAAAEYAAGEPQPAKSTPVRTPKPRKPRKPSSRAPRVKKES